MIETSKETLWLLRNIRRRDYDGSLRAYLKAGGYRAWRQVLNDCSPARLIEIVKESGLRGRGGAGFPTGAKWSFMPPLAKDKPNYLVANADESEPGTFKDHLLMLQDPHLFLEGMMLGCYAIGCQHGYIYIRGESVAAIQIMQKAVDEARQAGLLSLSLQPLELTIHPGAGAYICGEETALLDSLEGKRGQPRFRPPFPAQSGFDGCPTTVNNVETLANIPLILAEGASKFAQYGTPKNSGTQLVCLSGHVNKPGVYELEMGHQLPHIIQHFGGGLHQNRLLKAVIPGGASASVLKADEINIPYDFDSLAKAQTMRGSGALMVFDEKTDVVQLAERTIRFFNHESCGQCTPCREGTLWIRQMMRQFLDKAGNEDLLQRMNRIAGNMIGTTICAFGEAAGAPMQAFIQKFPAEFRHYFSHRLI